MVLTTRAQRKALYRLYNRNAAGFNTYRAFRLTVMPGLDKHYVGVLWCGMFVGIEQDGYTHT